MPMVSYSQNLEDVILQRALRYVQKGCYVDVGASLPDTDSLSYAFYRRGWRGICVEPQAYGDGWNRLRPEDTFINAAVGEEQGSAILHVYDRVREVSTASPESIAHWRQFGFQADRSVSVPILTLNQILNDHLRGRTLQSRSTWGNGMWVCAGGSEYRLIHVEATIPGTPVPCFEKWESLIISHGYRMVYFDGINRFYLSDEMQGLLPHFAHPPNVFDDYVPAIQVAQHERIAELEVKVGQLTDELAFARRPTQ